ncbi:hypothetical protein C5167_038401 [Papaver somniferum]|uniref:Uncharacterized protein n=1 Tax=Papaver somniferum TaxID=3469 RepID=A0A4Y7I933_PAPSO|nr:hypothetical protein C5167_038401 [Papaver somniferum]
MISKEIEVEIESDSENTESDEEQTKDQLEASNKKKSKGCKRKKMEADEEEAKIKCMNISCTICVCEYNLHKNGSRRRIRNIKLNKNHRDEIFARVWKLECRTPMHMSKEIMVNFRQGCNNNHHSRLLLAPTTMMVEIMLLKIEVKLLTPHRFSSQICSIVKFQYQRGNKL